MSKKNVIGLLFLLVPIAACFSQGNKRKPEIKGQTPNPLTIAQGQSITVEFTHLVVEDPDSNYPTGFTLTVYAGNNYTVAGSTITPNANFSGNLKVPVSVNDGKDESKKYDLKIEVTKPQSTEPKITGQVALSVNQGQSLTIAFSHLIVADPDNTYPNGFTLTVYAGNNYTVAGTTITPVANFSGNLKVPVSVNDGQNESKKFDLKIEVTKPQSTAPEITGQVALSVSQGQSLTIAFSHLVVVDPDNAYPNGFTLTVYAGNNYTVTGTTITPDANFSGNLKVPVSVNDGQNESKKFDLKIDVQKPQSVAPQITGQKPLTTNEEQGISVSLGDLTVADPDNTYPQGFTLKLFNGPNYSVSGSIVTPAKDYSGNLHVIIRVNDGKNDSAPFELQITVTPVNDAPLITGHKNLSTDQATPIAIALTDLTVVDPDNEFPADFSLTITTDANYIVAGTTINPAPTFSGTLEVIVSVSDGDASSPPFIIKVDVVPVQTNVAPTIVGQRSISITQGATFTLQLSHLIVQDPDNQFPADFSLKIFPGANYVVNDSKITPATNLVNGTLSVSVSVNDGTAESPRFEVKIQVTPISATPKINGQQELTMLEDSTLTIRLTDLTVADADNPDYPKGFTLQVLSDAEGVYQAAGNTIRPAPDFNGLLEVRITVSDGRNTSDIFNLAIFVTPQNDAPRITPLAAGALSYEPGKDPIHIFQRLVINDVDNEYLAMAEVGFRQPNFSAENDEILYDFDTTKIRPIHDPDGRLFLIGYASVEEYQVALRSMRYNYLISMDHNGRPDPIVTGSRTLYVNVNDGQSISLTSERTIDIEARITLDIPNAFTPNGDNENDTWHLRTTNVNDLDQTIIRVFNKRGLLIYESDRIDQQWDGTFNGHLLPGDTYFYTIVVKLPYTRQTYNGTVSILY